METSDEMLAEAACSGDAKAFAALVERHYDLVFRLGYRVLGNRADAQDLAQDVCAALPAKLRSYRTRSRFTTWLYTVVLNAGRDRLRRRATRVRAAHGWGEAAALAQAAEAENCAQRDWLQQAMTALPGDLRETVALILGEDLSQAEAAEILGVAQGTISWRMSEVKRHLRALAEAEEKL